ncbi:MAG: cytochrome c5 family protein [Gammaproteobacteria bacterium]|nr:cytochrome c5 family protein [Gammaproteobacteria bacterium]
MSAGVLKALGAGIQIRLPNGMQLESFWSAQARVSWAACFIALSLMVSGCAESTDQAEEAVHPGLQIYINYCASCHNAGVADAPKLGDKKQWSWRVEKGRSVLVQNTINGMPPAMPKKGLCMSCTDEELANAVDYMLNALE